MERFPVGDGPVSDQAGVGRIHVEPDDGLEPAGVAVAECGVLPADPADGAVHRIEMHRRQQRRKLRSVLDVEGDGLVAQVLDEVRPPVRLDSGREQRVEHALEGRERQRADEIDERCPERRTDGFEPFLRVLDRPGVAPHDCDHGLRPERLRERWPWWHVQEREEATEVLGCLGHEVAVPAEHVGREGDRPDHGARVDGIDRMQPEQERRHDPEVATTAPDRPEQVGVFLRARGDGAGIGENELRREHAVDRQPESTGQVTDPAAESQTTDAGRRDEAARRGHPERVRRVVDVTPGAARLHAHRAGAGVDGDALHRREVDDEAVIHGTHAGGAVPATSDGDRETVRSTKTDRRHDVRDVAALHDHPRVAVDHAVVDPASRVVVGIARADDPSAERPAQSLDGRLLKSSARSCRHLEWHLGLRLAVASRWSHQQREPNPRHDTVSESLGGPPIVHQEPTRPTRARAWSRSGRSVVAPNP